MIFRGTFLGPIEKGKEAQDAEPGQQLITRSMPAKMNYFHPFFYYPLLYPGVPCGERNYSGSFSPMIPMGLKRRMPMRIRKAKASL